MRQGRKDNGDEMRKEMIEKGGRRIERAAASELLSPVPFSNWMDSDSMSIAGGRDT